MSHKGEAKAFGERERMRRKGFGVEAKVIGLQRNGISYTLEEVIGGGESFSFKLFDLDSAHLGPKLCSNKQENRCSVSDSSFVFQTAVLFVRFERLPVTTTVCGGVQSGKVESGRIMWRR